MSAPNRSSTKSNRGSILSRLSSGPTVDEVAAPDVPWETAEQLREWHKKEALYTRAASEELTKTPETAEELRVWREKEAAEKWAATLFQQLVRNYRLPRRYMFAEYGHRVFSRHDGSPSDYGHINFGTGRKPRFITVSSSTCKLADVLAEFMQHYWKLKKPEVLISVTGGAGNFDLDRDVKSVFDQGIVKAISSAQAWVVTGGTDAVRDRPPRLVATRRPTRRSSERAPSLPSRV